MAHPDERPTRRDPRRAIAGAGAIALVGLVVLLGLAWRGSSPDTSGSRSSGSPQAPAITPTPAVSGISKEQAIAAAEAFLGRPLASPNVDGPTDWPGGRYYEVWVYGGPPNFWVDASSGQVIQMMLDVPDTTLVNYSPDQAKAAAVAFLTQHGIPFDGMSVTVELRDHGCCKEYEVTWQRYVNGASVPDTRIVGVDPATGKVFSVMDRRIAYNPVPTPVIARDDAIARAIKASGMSSPKIENVELSVASGPTWPGRLVWSVQLSEDVPITPGSSVSYVSAMWIYVDAVTGEAIVYGQG